MKDILPNIDADSFTLSSMIIGYALIGDLSPAEQNSVGNWFMMVGQVLCTHSAQQQVIFNNNSNSSTTNDVPIVNEVDSLRRSMDIINDKLHNFEF